MGNRLIVLCREQSPVPIESISLFIVTTATRANECEGEFEAFQRDVRCVSQLLSKSIISVSVVLL